MLEGLEDVTQCSASADRVQCTVREPEGFLTEEERSKRPSVFSVVRALVQLFASPEDSHLGFYGAFGYDLSFQFDAVKLKTPRDPEQRDLVLYIPDELLVINHQQRQAWRVRYEFVFSESSG